MDTQGLRKCTIAAAADEGAVGRVSAETELFSGGAACCHHRIVCEITVDDRWECSKNACPKVNLMLRLIVKDYYYCFNLKAIQ